jgi:hypothetical protein
MKVKIEVTVVKIFDVDSDNIESSKEILYDKFLSEELDLDIMEDYDDVKISVQRWV